MEQLINNKKYRELVIKHMKEQLIFFLQNSIEFSIVVHMDEGVDFNPSLPEEIISQFREYTIFTLAGYTFKSAFIENNSLIFEAGFGPDNIGAMVYVDLDRILQIMLGDTPIFINITATAKKEINQPKNSFEIFASKNRNKKFFKK